ncbi:MAG: ParA family protein [Xanthomonadales bacterium]|nr:ParA family protein [Xanthomonadales bacterium]
MRTITIVNPKGGCGKTTIATCLASHLSWDGYKVALADLDPQQSTTDWAAQRSDSYPEIEIIPSDAKAIRASRGTDIMVIDSPAGVQGAELRKLVQRSTTLLVPILPSPIDMRASWRFLEQLFELTAVQTGKVKVGLIANRVKENTIVYRELTGFLGKYRAPYVAHLRSSMNYVRAAEKGLGVADLPRYLAAQDWEEWKPLMRWIKSKRSQAKT